MTLREKQSKFTHLLARLILFMEGEGFEVTIGETYRSPEEAERLAKLGKGIKGSLHTKRLAADLHLFDNGKYLMDTESYRIPGTWWENQSTDEIKCCWGGHFGDGNHFSVEHGGKK